MNIQKPLLTALAAGRVEGFSSLPRVIETVVSRVYVFDQEERVLKFYKRDNVWWNSSMRDISSGRPRSSFIRQDFAFNQHLNPKIYLELKTAQLVGDRIKLVDPALEDDELVIVMKKQSLTGVLTDVLMKGTCTLDDYRAIGAAYPKAKLAIPRSFLPASDKNWYEHMQQRLIDLAEWCKSVPSFPADVRDRALSQLAAAVEEHKELFEILGPDRLHVLIDGHCENLMYENGVLMFMDAHPPKDSWMIGAFEVDIFRTGADIYALVGKEAYDAYITSAAQSAGAYLNMSLASLYLLYGALIMCPYFFMLREKNAVYTAPADAYLRFLQSLLR